MKAVPALLPNAKDRRGVVLGGWTCRSSGAWPCPVGTVGYKPDVPTELPEGVTNCFSAGLTGIERDGFRYGPQERRKPVTLGAIRRRTRVNAMTAIITKTQTDERNL